MKEAHTLLKRSNTLSFTVKYRCAFLSNLLYLKTKKEGPTPNNFAIRFATHFIIFATKTITIFFYKLYVVFKRKFLSQNFELTMEGSSLTEMQ